MENTAEKAIITVVGKDTIGIIAKVSAYLSESKVNILDISQTIVSGFFNMMMIVDTAACSKDFDSFSDELTKIGEDMGCIIHAQREEIFDKMHRI